jgi:hypothetical protein
MMSLGAVPAYLIARRLVARPWLAVVAAVCVLALPSFEYTGTIMTENAFFPAILFCVWAFVRALEAPTLARQVVALAFVVLAAAIRIQAVLFAAALLCAIVAYVLAEAGRAGELRNGRAVLRRLDAFRLTWMVVAMGGIAALAFQLARGRSIGSLFGAYREVTSWTYAPGPLLRWAVYHLAELDLYSGFLPFAAFVVVTIGAFRRAERSPALTAFAATSLAFVVWLTLPAAALSAHQGLWRIEERDVFYLVALLIVATVVWVDRGLPRGRLGTAAAVLAGALPGVIPFTLLVNFGTLSDTLALVPLARLVAGHALALDDVALVVVLAAIAGAAVFLFLPQRLALAVPFALLAFFIAWETPVERQMRTTSNNVVNAGLAGPRREWIESTTGRNADVAALWTGNSPAYPLLEDEFFNRSVRRVYAVDGSQLPGTAPETPATVDGRSGRLLDAAGKAVPGPWVLVDRTLQPAGRAVDRDVGTGMTLYRVPGDVVVRARTRGMYGDGWSGPSITYTRWRCDGGQLVTLIANYPGLVKTRQVVRASGGGRTVQTAFGRKVTTHRLVVPLRPSRGICTATFSVSPTAVPAQVLGLGDVRDLGVQFTALRYEP